MSRKRSPIRCAAALIAALVTALPAQQRSNETEACNREFARFLVEQQASEARDVSDAGKRIRILIRTARFLWKLDQPAARGHFAEAFKVARDNFAERGHETRREGGLVTRLPDYRFEVISAIAPLDGAWARKLTEQVLQDIAKQAEERAKRQAEEFRELDSIARIAVENLKTNPDLSRTLFRRLMRERLGFHWTWALYSAYEGNPAITDSLYDELLTVYAAETPRRLLFLSAYPFGSDRLLGIERFQWGVSVPATFAAKSRLQQRFIETFLRRSASYGADPASVNRIPDLGRQPEAVYIVTAIQDLEPAVVRDFPALMPLLSQARAGGIALLNDESRRSIEQRQKSNETLAVGFEQRLAELEKAEAEGRMKDSMIVQLVTWGSKTEPQFRQLESWLDKIKSDEARRESTNYFWHLRAKLAIDEDRLADAHRYAEKVAEVDHRAVLLFDLARKQIQIASDVAGATQILNDVGRLARKTSGSVAAVKVMLGLATLYEKINHSFAIDELSDVVRAINRLEDADLLSRSVTRRIITPDSSFYAVFELAGSDLETTFRELSKNDFELTLSNARAIDDSYYRTLAVIAVAQNCVDKEKPPLTNQRRRTSQ